MPWPQRPASAWCQDEDVAPSTTRLWLDIEHTVGKRYFTWDRAAFPTPDALDAQLRPKGRRLIAIADPHLKAEELVEIAAPPA